MGLSYIRDIVMGDIDVHLLDIYQWDIDGNIMNIHILI